MPDFHIAQNLLTCSNTITIWPKQGNTGVSQK